MNKILAGVLLALGLSTSVVASANTMEVVCQRADITYKKINYDRSTASTEIRSKFTFGDKAAIYGAARYLSSNDSEDNPEYTTPDKKYTLGYHKSNETDELEVYLAQNTMNSDDGPYKITFFTKCEVKQ